MKRLLAFALLFLAVGFVKAQAKPAMPIKVTFHENELVKGTYVAHFGDWGSTSFFLHAKFERADDSASKSFGLVIPDNLIREVGHNQGWDVKSGDIIKMTSEGYQDLQIRVP